MSILCPNHGDIRQLDTRPYAARFDEVADIWEVFLDPDCTTYVGCADDLDEAENVAKRDKEDKGCW